MCQTRERGGRDRGGEHRQSNMKKETQKEMGAIKHDEGQKHTEKHTNQTKAPHTPTHTHILWEKRKCLFKFIK